MRPQHQQQKKHYNNLLKKRKNLINLSSIILEKGAAGTYLSKEHFGFYTAYSMHFTS